VRLEGSQRVRSSDHELVEPARPGPRPPQPGGTECRIGHRDRAAALLVGRAGHSLLAPELTLLLPLARFLGLTWLIIVGLVLSGPGRAEQDRDHGMNR
jgi:hypothetical protein